MTRKQSPCRSLLVGLILAALPASGCREPVVERTAQTTTEVVDAAGAERDVRAVLQEQVNAWNQGSIPRFMEGYARTDSLRFASGGDVWYGWEETLARYEKSFADEASMGTLSFDGLKVDVLSPERALVFGRWRLNRTGDLPDAGGLFTLLFEKRSGNWRIVYDHTSAESADAQKSDSNEHQDHG